LRAEDACDPVRRILPARAGIGAGLSRGFEHVIEVRFRYRGSLAARNCDLIQPLNWSLSTCIQSPSRFVTLKRMPFGGFPTTPAFVEGADLIFTPGRCKKRSDGTRAALIHFRTFTGHSGSYACAGSGTTCRG
jgi:hypothetical protein